MSDPPKLQDRVRAAIRMRHYSRRTEEAYVGWVERFIFFYEIIDDPTAEERNQVRVVDESGEDYLYPKSWLLFIKLPQLVEEQPVNLASK